MPSADRHELMGTDRLLDEVLAAARRLERDRSAYLVMSIGVAERLDPVAWGILRDAGVTRVTLEQV